MSNNDDRRRATITSDDWPPNFEDFPEDVQEVIWRIKWRVVLGKRTYIIYILYYSYIYHIF